MGKSSLFHSGGMVTGILLSFLLLPCFGDQTKIQILKKNGRELIVDRYEKEGGFIYAYSDNSKIILPEADVTSIQPITLKPKLLIPSGKPRRVIFEKPETFSGTVAHYRLFCEKNKVEAKINEQARINLEKFLQETYPLLEKLAYKSQFTKENVVYFAETISTYLKQNGYAYQFQELLSVGLATKKIDCDLYSLLYLSAAENAHIPNGVLTFITIEPEKGKSLQRLTNGKYVNTGDANIGHAYLKFSLNTNESLIIETTSGGVYQQPLFIGNEKQETTLSDLEKQIQKHHASELSQKGLNLLKERKIDEGIKILESANSTVEKEKEILFFGYLLKGDTLAKAHQLSEAQGYAEKARKLIPNHPESVKFQKYLDSLKQK